jgi:hypothetical protein
VKPIGQNVARYAQGSLKVAEAACTIKCITHDKQRPTVPDDIERPSHWTWIVLHSLSLSLGHFSSLPAGRPRWLPYWLHFKTDLFTLQPVLN